MCVFHARLLGVFQTWTMMSHFHAITHSFPLDFLLKCFSFLVCPGWLLFVLLDVSGSLSITLQSCAPHLHTWTVCLALQSCIPHCNTWTVFLFNRLALQSCNTWTIFSIASVTFSPLLRAGPFHSFIFLCLLQCLALGRGSLNVYRINEDWECQLEFRLKLFQLRGLINILSYQGLHLVCVMLLH